MKKLLLMFGVLLGLLIAAVLIAPMFISQEMVTSRLISEAEKASGRKISITGETKLRIFPFAGVTVHGLSVSGAKPEITPHVLSVDTLDVDVGLLALLSGDIQVKKLVLESPKLTLRRAKDGVLNALSSPIQLAQTENQSTDATKEEPAKLPFQQLSLSGIKISHGLVEYIDEAGGARWTVADINASAKLDGLQSPLETEGSANINQENFKWNVRIGSLQKILAGNKNLLQADINSELISLVLKGAIENQAFTGTSEIKSASLAKLGAWGSGKKPATSSKPLALYLKGNASCGATQCSVEKATIALDHQAFEGNIKALYGGKIPVVEANLSAGKLDLTPFLVADASLNLPSLVDSAYAQTGHWDTTPINLSALDSINLLLRLKAETVQINQLAMGQTAMLAKVSGGALSIDLPKAQAYQGTINSSMMLDKSGKLAGSLSLDSIQAEPLLAALAGYDRLKGVMQGMLRYSSSGQSVVDFISNLEGNGQLRLNNGALKGINIAELARNISSGFTAGGSGSQQTDFSEIGGSFIINKGIISNSDLAMKAPMLRLSGKGTINLPQYWVNYRLMPELVETAQGQGGKDKKGFGVPIIVEGSLDNPSFRPDLQSTIEEIAKDPEKLKNTVKDIKQQFKGDKAKDAVKNIKGLLKGL